MCKPLEFLTPADLPTVSTLHGLPISVLCKDLRKEEVKRMIPDPRIELYICRLDETMNSILGTTAF